MRHAVSVKQFSDKTLLASLFKRAGELQALPIAEYPKSLQHMTLATIFYEPSTRTRLSFEAAIQNLGANLISTENAGQFSSAIKGESLEDTIRIISSYTHGIVIRHPENDSAERAAAVSGVPIINAGAGTHEHPTQALLDMYTIFRRHKKIDGLRIALVGDLANGRTVHSLIPLLSLYAVAKIYLVAPSSLRMPDEYLTALDKHKITYEVLDSYENILSELDVLYMTRVQKERFPSTEAYDAVKNSFVFTLADAAKMKPDASILHPLPRVNEIAPEVDADARAQYFQQAGNGLFMRMALLEWIYASGD